MALEISIESMEISSRFFFHVFFKKMTSQILGEQVRFFYSAKLSIVTVDYSVLKIDVKSLDHMMKSLIVRAPGGIFHQRRLCRFVSLLVCMFIEICHLV